MSYYPPQQSPQGAPGAYNPPAPNGYTNFQSPQKFVPPAGAYQPPTGGFQPPTSGFQPPASSPLSNPAAPAPFNPNNRPATFAPPAFGAMPTNSVGVNGASPRPPAPFVPPVAFNQQSNNGVPSNTASHPPPTMNQYAPQSNQFAHPPQTNGQFASPVNATQNTLPNRFAPPPPVNVPQPNVAAAIASQQQQVVFNQVQPLRPFEDQQYHQPPAPLANNNNIPTPLNNHSNPAALHNPALQNSYGAPSQPFQSPHNGQSLAIPPSNTMPPPQQHDNYGQPQNGNGNGYNNTQQQYSNGQQQQQYNNGQQLQPPQQQNMYGQQQQQSLQAPPVTQYQDQYAQQNGYQGGNMNPLQSPSAVTPGGSVNKKRVDRIDPKQIPRRQDFPGAAQGAVRYHTRSMTLPPAATADYITIDEGNCSPRFVRLTTNNIAHESELIDSTKLCIGAIIQPLANLGDGEEPIPVVYTNQGAGPLRCSKCMAYVNPFFQFIDAGNAFNCNLCGMKNDVPDNYRCNLDANGLRRDRHDRPELSRGTVEFEVGADFILRPIQDPVFLFVIDVSYGAVVSGLVGAAITAVRSAIDQMGDIQQPDGSPNRLKVGIITYDQSVHFYSIKPGRTEPMMLVMSDVDEPFGPCPPEEICVHVAVEENRALLHSTLDMLASVYERNKVTENLPVFGAAIAAAAETLTMLGGGKILIMQSNLPTVGVGKLENRDQISLYFTEKEKSLQIPQNAFYQTLATKCAENAITVDLFVCSNGYVDLATVGALTEKTGGQIFLYPGFNAVKDGLALQRDIYHDVTRTTGYDGIMIVRCSAGLKVAEHYGNFYHRKVQEMELATINCDATFGVRLEHEGKLKDKTEACIQCALLYTTQSGRRRIRVHTISVPVTSVMSNIFRFADLDAIVNLSLKQAVRQLLDTTTCNEAQNALTMACIESLFVYRKFCASATSAGQLILPEPLKLLPLCTLGLVKHPLFQDGLAADERSFLFAFVNSMPCYVSVAFVCPRLFDLTNFDQTACVPDETGRVYLPMPLTLSSESVSSNGLYLLDDGRYMYLYIGSDLPMQLLEEVFVIKGDGKSTAGQYRIRNVPGQPHHVSSRINQLIGTLRKNKPTFQNLQFISRRPPATHAPMTGPSPSPTNRGWETFESLDESLFFSHLIEDSVIKPQSNDPRKDKNTAGGKPPNTMSYIDWLCYIHKRIQAKFL